MHRDSFVLLIAAVLLVASDRAHLEVVGALIVVMAALVLSLRVRLGPWVVVPLLIAGVWIRLAEPWAGSDALATTRAALGFALDGGNPYGHGYWQSEPPGAPFPYGPLALLWYHVLPENAEFLAGLATMILLAARRAYLGLAVYAALVPMARLALDGANDVSAGLLILGGVALAERWPIAGAAVLGIAGGFKPYALAWLPGAVGYGGWRAGAAYLGAFVLAWLPAVVLWGLGPILWSATTAATMHEVAWYSLGFVWPEMGRDVAQAIALGVAGLAAVRALRVRSYVGFVTAGIVVLLAFYYLGWWATVAYVAAIMPAVCWNLDRLVSFVAPVRTT